MKNKARVVCNFNSYNTIDIDVTGDGELAYLEVNSQFSHNEISFDLTKKDAQKIIDTLTIFVNKVNK